MSDTPTTKPWPGILFGILVILFAASNSWSGLYPYGHAVWIRPLLSAIGIAGAICLLAGNGWWRILLPAWCLVQTWVIATDVSREWFYQGLNLGWNHAATVHNGHVLVTYESSGINFAGPILFLALLAITSFRLHPRVRREPSLKTLARISAAVAVVALLAFAIHALGATDDPVLDFDLPRVPIYYKGEMLGRTPLRITPALVSDHHLPLNSRSGLSIYGFGWGDCVILSDGKMDLPLYAAPTWPFSRYLDTFDSPWGTRCRMHLGTQSGEGSNYCLGSIFPSAALRGEPILTIQTLAPLPIPAASPLRLHCVLTNPTGEFYRGRKATITRLFFFYDRRSRTATTMPAKLRREITMPEAWNTLQTNATMTADLEFDGPQNPGDYELFCTWFLYAPTPSDSNTGVASNYSNMLWLRVR